MEGIERPDNRVDDFTVPDHLKIRYSDGTSQECQLEGMRTLYAASV